MDQIKPTLSDFKVLHGCKPDKYGRTLIATFTVSYAGIQVTSCVLLLREDGAVLAKGPKGRNLANRDVIVNFSTAEARHAITNQAASAYAAMTGIEV